MKHVRYLAGLLVVLVVSVGLSAGAPAAEPKKDPAPADKKPEKKPGKKPEKKPAAEVKLPPVGRLPGFVLQPRHKVMGLLVRYYRPMRIMLADKAPEDLKAQPKYRSKKPLYGSIALGELPGKPIAVVLDEPEGEKPRIYVDRNNDRDLTNDGPGEWSRDTKELLSLNGLVLDAPYRAGPIPYTLNLYRFNERLRELVLYYRDSGREGRVELDGKTYSIAVLDDNADGRFDDLANGALILDLNQDGKLEGDTDSAEYYPLDEPLNVHGKVWEVASVSADGLAITFRPSGAQVAMKPYLTPGNPALPFAVTGLDGKPLDLKTEAAGAKYVLLDFWASWCGPCRKEFPRMRALYAQYKGHGLRVIGINLDTDRDVAVQVAQDALLGYRHTFDGLAWKSALAQLYRVGGIPQTYLLDKDMKIVAKGLYADRLQKRLEELLGPGDKAAAEAAQKQAEKIAAEKKAAPEQEKPGGKKQGANTSSPKKASEKK